MQIQDGGSALRRELEERIRGGRCVYCRAPAAPDEPLTREHVIPRARGGRRKDLRIIVPACLRCNRSRGCQEVVLFLLARPRRITAFLEYLSTLPPTVVRQIDLRVFSELYATVSLLDESLAHGREWRAHLQRLSSGRRLHRRRYAARRLLTTLDSRLDRRRHAPTEGPSCPIAPPREAVRVRGMDASTDRLRATLFGLLALLWDVSGERIAAESGRLEAHPEWLVDGAVGTPAETDDGVVALDGWRRPRGRRRALGDRRRGRVGGRNRAA